MNTTQTKAHQAAEIIKVKHPSFLPKIGIVLGSGLGVFAEQLTNQVTIPYSDLPGFPHVSVHGHAGKLILGELSGIPVACLQGRAHAYEGNNHEIVKTYVRTLKLLGCDYFIATNAAGSLREDINPGDLVLITDHMNFQPNNPLVGPNDDQFGPRFYGLDQAYDQDMRQHLLKVAKDQGISLHQGIYVAVLGPNYETAAEVRAFRQLGGDVVGMSTVPEVLVAAHCGMRVAVISIATNYATGLNATAHSHDEVVRMASVATKKLSDLLMNFMTFLS